MPVRELLARTTSRELAEWMAYERLTGPLDSRLRGDIQAAIVAATVANSQRAKGGALKPADFLPEWEPSRPRTPEEIWQDVIQINAALGGEYRTTA
ncbi:phage tail assembly protein T [Streptomyces thermodiastaticus]|uniref:phage tail assembly protein T n=1 Tax=Streptomyces thermodiastaticus TaxID=44061 RepID=UPI00167A275F|nr:DUF4035 domain-containing protein [Streptomyces thermodiastaticus]MCE7550908.1 DUF4035 domain-containing protein [Streptomyces thermodiastaticus]GHF73903.1 hypothetical protein GCM10018787_23240 [Streptomyces thermodiastaticus]